MAKAKSERAATATADRPREAVTVGSANVACRAYDLYLARGCEHGHDVEDWLQAERELRTTAHSAAA